MAWEVAMNIKGPQGDPGATGATGAAGARGAKWYSGAGAPGTIADSLPGDWYLDTVSGEVYNLT